jgi:riboflavin synthase
VSNETLALTTLGRLRVGDAVNLEAALRAGDPLGGHLMSGHVDGVAEVVGLAHDARSLRVEVEVPGPLARYLAPKGSVALDGVSLTVNEVEGTRFGVNLIPHTAEVTTFGNLGLGQRLNIEVDQLARYVQRALGLPG